MKMKSKTTHPNSAAKIAHHIARRMIELREQHRLSLQAVADRCGLTKSHIWDLEAGNATNPTIDTAVRIARAFGVSLDYLIGSSSTQPDLHPEALRIAVEIDVLLRKGSDQR